MITIRKNDMSQFPTMVSDGDYRWLNVINPSGDDLRVLSEDYGIDREWLNDVLDMDEQVRIEKEDGNLFLIVRVPVNGTTQEVPYQTVPLGIFIREKTFVTVCLSDNDVLRTLMVEQKRNRCTSSIPNFVLSVILRSANFYLRYLKDINRRTNLIEKDLQQSIKNYELVALLNIEKSLVFFTTSLKSNELLLEKLRKVLSLNEEEKDFLEDAIIENKQAIEMANIYSNILSGMMDAFASVISNNLNVVMKRLTSISLILMVPTLIASLYGMNVKLPLGNSPWAFVGILAGSVVLSLVSMVFFRKRNFL